MDWSPRDRPLSVTHTENAKINATRRCCRYHRIGRRYECPLWVKRWGNTVDEVEAATALSLTGRILRRGLVTPRSETKKPPLFVKQRLPVRRHRSGRSRHRLIQRMRVRSVKPR